MPRLEGRPNRNTLQITADLAIESVHDSVWGWARPGRCKVAGCEITTETWDQHVLEHINLQGWVPRSYLWARVCRPQNWDTGPFAWICPEHYADLMQLHDEFGAPDVAI